MISDKDSQSFLNIKFFNLDNNGFQNISEFNDTVGVPFGTLVDVVSFGNHPYAENQVVYGVLYNNNSQYQNDKLQIRLFIHNTLNNTISFNSLPVGNDFVLDSGFINFYSDVIENFESGYADDGGIYSKTNYLLYKVDTWYANTYENRSVKFKLVASDSDTIFISSFVETININNGTISPLFVNAKKALLYNNFIYFATDQFGQQNIKIYKLNPTTNEINSTNDILNITVNTDDTFNYVDPFIDMKLNFSNGNLAIFYHKQNGYSSSDSKSFRREIVNLNTFTNSNLFKDYNIQFNFDKTKIKIYYNFSNDIVQFFSLDINNAVSGNANLLYAFLDGNNLSNENSFALPNTLTSSYVYTNNFSFDFTISSTGKMFIFRDTFTNTLSGIIHYSNNYNLNEDIIKKAINNNVNGLVVSEADENGYFDYYTNV
jgi:hypothetical protein